jgi:predicted nucleic acid-binding protein
VILVADTGGLLVALDQGHRAHRAARSALNGAALTVVSPTTLVELDHLIRRQGKAKGWKRHHSAEVSRAALAWIGRETATTRMCVPAVDDQLLTTARSVMEVYAGLALDLADAVNVALADAYKTDRILTTDHRDFRGIRPLTSHVAFRLLPEDS